MAHEIPVLEATKRDKLGSRYAARLRVEGRLPAVIYGHGQDNIHVTVDAKAFTELLHENTHLVQLRVDTTEEPCLIRDTQWDYLGDDIIHVDLARVDLNEKVTVEIELIFHGEPKALEEEGAILLHPHAMIEIECLATDIPDEIRVDVSELTLETTITVADLQLPEGVETTWDAEELLAQITIQEELPEVEEEEATEEGAEPEVIGRDEDEEGEAGDDED